MDCLFSVAWLVPRPKPKCDSPCPLQSPITHGAIFLTPPADLNSSVAGTDGTRMVRGERGGQWWWTGWEGVGIGGLCCTAVNCGSIPSWGPSSVFNKHNFRVPTNHQKYDLRDQIKLGINICMQRFNQLVNCSAVTLNLYAAWNLTKCKPEQVPTWTCTIPSSFWWFRKGSLQLCSAWQS